MATASQKMTEIKFLERMRGALMAAPTSDDPVVKIPLRGRVGRGQGEGGGFGSVYVKGKTWVAWEGTATSRNDLRAYLEMPYAHKSRDALCAYISRRVHKSRDALCVYIRARLQNALHITPSALHGTKNVPVSLSCAFRCPLRLSLPHVPVSISQYTDSEIKKSSPR